MIDLLAFVTVPGEIAIPIGGAASAAIGILWKRTVTLEDRSQQNIERMIESNQSVIRALDAMGEMIKRGL